MNIVRLYFEGWKHFPKTYYIMEMATDKFSFPLVSCCSDPKFSLNIDKDQLYNIPFKKGVRLFLLIPNLKKLSYNSIIKRDRDNIVNFIAGNDMSLSPRLLLPLKIYILQPVVKKITTTLNTERIMVSYLRSKHDEMIKYVNSISNTGRYNRILGPYEKSFYGALAIRDKLIENNIIMNEDKLFNV